MHRLAVCFCCCVYRTCAYVKCSNCGSCNRACSRAASQQVSDTSQVAYLQLLERGAWPQHAPAAAAGEQLQPYTFPAQLLQLQTGRQLVQERFETVVTYTIDVRCTLQAVDVLSVARQVQLQTGDLLLGGSHRDAGQGCW